MLPVPGTVRQLSVTGDKGENECESQFFNDSLRLVLFSSYLIYLKKTVGTSNQNDCKSKSEVSVPWYPGTVQGNRILITSNHKLLRNYYQ